MNSKPLLMIFGLLMLAASGCVSYSTMQMKLDQVRAEQEAAREVWMDQVRAERRVADEVWSAHLHELVDHITCVEEALAVTVYEHALERTEEDRDLLDRIAGIEWAVANALAKETTARATETAKVRHALAAIEEAWVASIRGESLERGAEDDRLQEIVMGVQRDLGERVTSGMEQAAERVGDLRVALETVERDLGERVTSGMSRTAEQNQELQLALATVEREMAARVEGESLVRSSDHREFLGALAAVEDELLARIDAERGARADAVALVAGNVVEFERALAARITAESHDRACDADELRGTVREVDGRLRGMIGDESLARCEAERKTEERLTEAGKAMTLLLDEETDARAAELACLWDVVDEHRGALLARLVRVEETLTRAAEERDERVAEDVKAVAPFAVHEFRAIPRAVEGWTGAADEESISVERAAEVATVNVVQRTTEPGSDRDVVAQTVPAAAVPAALRREPVGPEVAADPWRAFLRESMKDAPKRAFGASPKSGDEEAIRSRKERVAKP